MKHTIENISDVEKKITIEIPKETIQEEVEETYGYLKKNASIKGFRKGKIPRNILEMHYKDQVLSDVMSKLINDSYTKSIEENKLSPVAYPKFDAEKLDITKDYKYTATVFVKPDITIENYKGLSLEKEEVEIGPKDIDAVLNHLKETQSVLKVKKTETLAEGDFAVTEIVASMNGKQLTPDNSKTQTVEIGKKMLHPDIEKALLKLKKGEETTITTKLDESIKDKKFAGKETVFKVKLKEIREKETPKIDDNFARSLGPHKDLNDLKDAVKDQIKLEREKKSNMAVQNEALNKLVEMNKFEVPQSMVDGEKNYMINDFKAHAARQGLQGKALEAELEKSKPELEKEAEKRVRESLILEEIAKKEKIEASETDVNSRIEIIAKNMGAKPEQVREYYSKDNAIASLKSQIAAEKTLDFIVKNADVKTLKPKKEKEAKSAKNAESKEESKNP